MRVVLVGSPEERRRLRRAASESGLTIAGEAATIASARALGIDADALVVAPTRRAPSADGTNAIVAEALTPRETEVLELVAEGLPNKAIAARLGISDQTVKFHVASICGKLGATNRTDAVRRAVERGLITL